MMIRVEITEAHPFPFGERSEVWMRLVLKIVRYMGEPLDESLELAEVGIEDGGRSAADLLVELRRGLESVPPRDRSPDGNPFDDSSRNLERRRGHGFLAHVHPIAVRQMADHLVRRHRAPFSLAGRAYGLQATEDFLLVGGVGESFHRPVRCATDIVRHWSQRRAATAGCRAEATVLHKNLGGHAGRSCARAVEPEPEEADGHECASGVKQGIVGG